MLAESISGPELGMVTVAVIEESVHTLPLPANIYFASNGDKYGGNLAFRMLKTKLHELSHLPFPLPLAAGMWLHVSVEGQECQLRNGEEIEPTVGFLTFKQRLQESAKTASFPDELLIGRPVLGLSLSRRRNL